MVFLHISQKLFTSYLDGGGELYKGVSRPSGLWYGHGLSWVKVMDEKKSWSPQLLPSDMHPLPAYQHVFEGKKLLGKQPGDKFNTFKAPHHYVYALPIPDDAFQSPSYSGDDKLQKIMKITPETIDELLEMTRDRRKEWYETSAATALDASFGGADPLRSITNRQQLWKSDQTGQVNPDETYIAILKYLLTTDALGGNNARAEQIIAGDKAVPIIDLKSSRELRGAIAKGIFENKIGVDSGDLDIVEDLFWQPVVQEFQGTWGGMDFSGDVFTREYIRKLPVIRFIGHESGVLFRSTKVLAKTVAWQDIAAIITWYEKPVFKDPRINGLPKYVFGITTKGKVRILLEEPKSAGGRRKTRRRVLKNPKTLKKRVRKVVLLRML